MGINADDYRQSFIKTIPMKRLAAPEEVANAIIFLASDDASYITGIALNVAGGSMVH